MGSNSLVSALDTILLVKICDKNQPLRMCNHCEKLFIAENVRAEYCSPQCRNQANYPGNMSIFIAFLHNL